VACQEYQKTQVEYDTLCAFLFPVHLFTGQTDERADSVLEKLNLFTGEIYGETM
jgi:hypothetical protein